MDLIDAAAKVEAFADGSITRRVSALEHALAGTRALEVAAKAPDINISLLSAASALKRAAGQINVLIHTVGLLVSLPYILVEAEVIESLSLGAGNTGRAFDLVTDRQVAEFKFIQWRGGPESIRQNSVFKDFYMLAEADTSKRRVLYVLGLDQPLKFFRGGRALRSVLSRNAKLQAMVSARYRDRFTKVSEYYHHRRDVVEMVDLTAVVPGIAEVLATNATGQAPHCV